MKYFKTICNMIRYSDISSTPKSYAETNNRIAFIQETMEEYIKSSIEYEVINIFIYGKNARWYLNPEIIDKCDSIHFPHFLTQPIHDVVADGFRYNYRNGIERPVFEENINSFFSEVYKDTYFLDKINESDWFICKLWYDFAISAIMNSDIIRSLGYCFYYFIEDDESDYQHHRSVNLSYKAANAYQIIHPEIKWSHMFGETF